MLTEINETFEDGTTPLTVSACYGYALDISLLCLPSVGILEGLSFY